MSRFLKSGQIEKSKVTCIELQATPNWVAFFIVQVVALVI
jgi:hypothetical protein